MGVTEPVVIQDKNGKITTVHRNIATNSHRTSMPVPPKPVLPIVEISNELILNSILDRPLLPGGEAPLSVTALIEESPNEANEALDYLGMEDPKVLLTATELMMTGTLTGQEMVKGALYSVLSEITIAISDRDSYYSDWSEALPSAEEVKKSLVRMWHLGAVIEDSGMPNTPETRASVEMASGFVNAKRRFIHYNEEDAPQDDETYWRGIGAISLTGLVDPFSPELPPYGREFMDWAGTQSDLAPIISVVMERGVLNPETIVGLLNQTGIEQSLTNGIL